MGKYRVQLTLTMLLALTGCVHYMPPVISTTPLGPKEKPVATISGESSAFYVLGLGPFGDDSVLAAIENALSRKDADTMENVFVDRQLTCFPVCGFSIFTSINTRIFGTLVKYQDPVVHMEVKPFHDPESDLLRK